MKGDTDLEVCAPVPQKRKTQKGKTRREKILCMGKMERQETEGEEKKKLDTKERKKDRWKESLEVKVDKRSRDAELQNHTAQLCRNQCRVGGISSTSPASEKQFLWNTLGLCALQH